MTKAHRIAMIALLYLAFLGISSFLISSLYGYDIDTKTLTVTKTGSISLAYNKRDATLAINGIIQKASPNLIWGNVLIKSLKPGTYRIELFMPGYHSYKKQLKVKAGLVTKAENITLWPVENRIILLSSGTVQAFGITKDGAIRQEDGRLLTEKNRKIRGSQLADSRSDSFYVVTKDADDVFLTDVRRPEQTVNIRSLAQSLLFAGSSTSVDSIISIRLYPNQADRLMIETSLGLYKLDIRNLNTRSLDMFLQTPNQEFSNKSPLKETLCAPGSDNNTLILSDLNNEASVMLPQNHTIVSIFSARQGCFIFTRDNGRLSKLTRNNLLWSIDSPSPAIVKETKNGRHFLMVDQNGRLYTGTLEYDKQGIFSGHTPFLEIPISLGRVLDADFLDHAENQIIILAESGLYLVDRDPREPANAILLRPDALRFTLDSNRVYVLTSIGQLIVIDLNNS